ncbi:MAG: hypothetical protein V3V00_05695 [Saprospiraceae bacterium]
MRTLKFGIILFCVFLITSCALLKPKPVPPKKITTYELSINELSKRDLQKDGVTININPITHENYKRYPTIFNAITYSLLQKILFSSKPVRREYSDFFILTNLPAFEVVISNNTDHIINLNKSAIRMVDDISNTYEAVGKGELHTKVNIYHNVIRNKGGIWDITSTSSKINRLRLLNKSTEILPGFTEKTYLSFDNPSLGKAELNSFFASRKYLKVLLFQVPTRLDKAGNITRTQNFECYFDIKRIDKLLYADGKTKVINEQINKSSYSPPTQSPKPQTVTQRSSGQKTQSRSTSYAKNNTEKKQNTISSEREKLAQDKKELETLLNEIKQERASLQQEKSEISKNATRKNDVFTDGSNSTRLVTKPQQSSQASTSYYNPDLLKSSNSERKATKNRVYTSQPKTKRIQVAASGRTLFFNDLEHLGEILTEPVPGRNMTRYQLGYFSEYEVKNVLLEVRSIGYKDAFVVK